MKVTHLPAYPQLVVMDYITSHEPGDVPAQFGSLTRVEETCKNVIFFILKSLAIF